METEWNQHIERDGNEWVFPDGKRLPVVSGGSDAGEYSFGSEEVLQEPEQEVVSGPGNPFLSEVAPDHRAIVAPYLQKWDANATKKFQEYSAKLKPWESIGMPPEEVQKYLNVARNLRERPEDVFRLMWTAFQDQYGDGFETELARILQIQLEEEQEMSEEYQQEYEQPGEEQVWRQNIENDVNEIRQWRQEQAQLAQEQEQEAQLDELLTNMHTQLGDFDDDYMLLMLSRHNDVGKAVKAYNAFVQRSSQSTRTPRQVPKTMGGQGGVPNGQVDVNKLRGNDRRKAVEAFLESAGQ